jgi:peptidoglycan/LPS O-acetylase OafA/YrhL
MTVEKPLRLLNLDILRLVSAALVMFFHYGFRMRISGEGGGAGFPELAPLAMWFDAGLLIFFAISGYVISMSAEGRTAYDFAAGRFARLWPTFIVCATITFIVLTLWPVPTLDAPTLKQWASHVVIVSRLLGQPFLDGAYWTIAYEITFYGWVFLMIASGLLERHWRIIIALWLVISVLNETLLHSGAVEKLLITEYSGYFAFGFTLFQVRKQGSAIGFAVLAAAALLAAATPFLTASSFVETYALSRSVLGLALMGPLSLGFVTIAILSPSLPISRGWAIALGGLTYPLYLLHQNIGYASFARFGATADRWIILSVLIPVLLIVSLVIAKAIEPPARRGIVRFATRLAPGLSKRQPRTA